MGTPLPTPEQFPEFVRANMVSHRSGSTPKDVSLDHWSTAYRLEYVGSKVRVVSAGPDKKFDTSDDVFSERDLG